MPAGRGRQCEACDGVVRLNRKAAQLAELISSKRARLAFLGYSKWLGDQGNAIYASARLHRHVHFFEELDRTADDAWTAQLLLERLGTAQLRRFELPVRWLQLHGQLVIGAEAKTAASELRRSAIALEEVPRGSLARSIVDGFSKELKRRVEEGTLAPRSMRLALRPAVGLLATEDPAGTRLPSESAVDLYLQGSPGQRAALSTFVGYLKRSCGHELALPAKSKARRASSREQIEKKILAIMQEPSGDPMVRGKWIELGLMFFHRLSAGQAKELLAQALVHSDSDGLHVVSGSDVYWLPSLPTTRFQRQ